MLGGAWLLLCAMVVALGFPLTSRGAPTCITSSSFLHASNAHLARRMQFGLRFQF
jgi:hypothetical protein